MKSRWFHLKDKAIKLRKTGLSIGFIERKLGIPRSTLSSWFRDISLTSNQKRRLKQNWINGLKKARKEAVIWHSAQKELRLKDAENKADHTLSN